MANHRRRVGPLATSTSLARPHVAVGRRVRMARGGSLAMTNAPTRADLTELRQLVSGYRVSQAIHAVATLGVADLLLDGPQESDALAATTGVHPEAFARVLRFLAGVGLFREVTPRRFALTPLGAGLRSDLPGSVRPMARMLHARA